MAQGRLIQTLWCGGWLAIFVNLLWYPSRVSADEDAADWGWRRPKPPIVLEETGGFSIGGKIIQSPFNPNTTLSCDWGYMEYFIPQHARKTSIVMWHSATTQAFQNNWAGGEGFKDIFLRLGYPVYLWDGPRVGRANWACNATSYVPDYRDQGNFNAWNFGPRFMEWWPNVQFPTEDPEAWQAATRTRYVEYDTVFNVEIETDAAAIAADSGKLGDSIVYITNSASGLRAMRTVTKSNTTNIKAIINFETVGLPFPDDYENIPPGQFGNSFDPYLIPAEDFQKLMKLKLIGFWWGDNRGPDSYVFYNQSMMVNDIINDRGGNAEFVRLGEDEGLIGSTHSAFADLDNHKVADVLQRRLRKYGLNHYRSGRRWLDWW